MSQLDLVHTLRTTGAVREFADAPVDDHVVCRLLDTARFAPNGGNRQAWRVVLVHDPHLRRELRNFYLSGWYEYLAQVSAGLCPWAPVTDEEAERHALATAGRFAAAAAAGPGGFAEHLDDVPVLLVLLADLGKLAAVDRDLDRYTMVGGGSIYPFAWSILLAARAEGLGGVMTTMATRREPEVKQLLGVPEHFAVAGLIALGRPLHQPKRLKRLEVAQFTTLDRLDGPALDCSD
jgi:nitroreductase